MIVVIDNYDSFTYNLVQAFGTLGAELCVFRNDQTTLAEIAALNPSHIVISPGPGTPDDGGVSLDVIREMGATTPILGVCLGHQCIGQAYGGQVICAPRLMHGKVSPVYHSGDRLFNGLPSPFDATRYHSLVVDEPMPSVLKVTAFTEQGEVMALRHIEYPVVGVQFHPESILTTYGPANPAKLFGKSLMSIQHALGKLSRRLDLTEQEAESAMDEIMTGGATSAQIGGYLMALRFKGETVDEITGSARSMRRAANYPPVNVAGLIDTCGTGGDGANTFNISTTVAFVVAGAGLPVAKHGNRSVSSKSGSADVLGALGVNLNMTPEQVGACIDAIGIGFLFAPAFHPAMKHAIGPRRELAVRTLFNVLGPLTNPAGARRQLMGVYAPELTEPLALVLSQLGGETAFVVHGDGGLDELTVSGPNRVSELRDGQVTTYTLDPREYGFAPCTADDLMGGDPQHNAAITRGILDGTLRGAPRSVVILNAAAGIIVGGRATNFPDAIRLAEDSIDSGAALVKLDALIAYSNQIGTAA